MLPKDYKLFKQNFHCGKRDKESDNFANFQMLKRVISQSQIDNFEALAPILHGNMWENLDRLQQSLKSYSSDDVNFELWICNLFLANLDDVCDDNLAKKDLIEIEDNANAKILTQKM